MTEIKCSGCLDENLDPDYESYNPKFMGNCKKCIRNPNYFDYYKEVTICNQCEGCYLTCKYTDKYRKNKKNKCRHFKEKSE